MGKLVERIVKTENIVYKSLIVLSIVMVVLIIIAQIDIIMN